MSKFILSCLGHLLMLANSDPTTTRRKEFYALKARLLEQYGRPVGYDWQVITRYCYRCEGGGFCDDGYDDGYGRDVRCERCGGTGIWDRFWVKLSRWEIGGYTFHTPGDRTWTKPDEAVRISGRIEHADHGRASDEAVLWLALLFDRPLFAALMTISHALDPTWRYPLVTIQKVTCRAAMLAHRFERRTCVSCGRSFRQGFRAPRCHTFECRDCDTTRRWTRVPERYIDDDTPF